MGCLLLMSTGPPIKRRAGLRIKQAGRGSYRVPAKSLLQFSLELCSVLEASAPGPNVSSADSHQLLTWEDGYCDIPKQGHSMENLLDNISFEGLPEMSSSNYESSTCDETFGGDTIGTAVAYMSNVQYPLGDGVVGEVASTGNYGWVFSGDLLSGEFNSKLDPECPDEWLFQFAAGIKTILLVPVVPHGVLQLGSLETVVEDLGMVALIKEKFVGHQHFLGDSESSAVNREFLAPSSSLLMSALIENMDDLSTLAMNVMKSEDSLTIDNVKPTVQKICTHNQITSLCKAHDSTLISETDLKISNPTEDDMSTQPGVIEEPDLLNQAPNFSKLGMMESTMYRCLEEDLPAFSYPNNSNMTIFGEYANKTMRSDRLYEAITNDNVDSTDHRYVGPFLSFPRDCELHKALGPTFMGSGNDYAWDSSICAEDVYCPSSLICNVDAISGTEGRETNGWLVNNDDPEHLLGPVVAETHLDVNSSGLIAGVNSSITSSGIPNTSLKRHNQTERSVLSGESTLSWSRVTSAVVSRDRKPTVSSLPAATSYVSGSMMSELIEDEQKQNFCYSNQRKISKVSGPSKRKGNPGDNKKPRPRDRQLIQDRLKELRELVPNGAKCSIDGLLDRTVAHMLFLKSASDRADKLRHWDHQEGVGRKTMKFPEQKGGRKFGTSWAFELGTDQQVCPIIVEDLEYPGHMLIEMICDENDRFLEIAEVIHGLNLTILKGTMEKRSDNTWAHFLIEAPRGLHRLDIFWPLMKLLQHNPSPISSKF